MKKLFAIGATLLSITLLFTGCSSSSEGDAATMKEAQPENKEEIAATQEKVVSQKDGDVYYSVGCAKVNEIKAEERVYHRTEQDAIDKGLKRADEC
ncbi:hypothetical protein IC620_04230 [Hazenella sp. IB182357]|uniref:Excalibur calcium-binding domain-containing protein n=1 Tax=Polycladospora coralii TaxID=2771432 RepID=A0A926RTD6_9BACL|nr:hypothetical protein [Polycladospora coralii]MBD1371563.1 hypothetical protein [Polycladospora coralii]MBS7529031.1 hypothetical protein [Polycladospora coralii]